MTMRLVIAAISFLVSGGVFAWSMMPTVSVHDAQIAFGLACFPPFVFGCAQCAEIESAFDGLKRASDSQGEKGA